MGIGKKEKRKEQRERKIERKKGGREKDRKRISGASYKPVSF